MQSICWFIVTLAFLAVAKKTHAETNQIISISSGTSFGRCIGYCRQSVSLMFDPLQVIISREANYNQASYPPVHLRSPFELNEWINLTNLADLEVFQRLDDRIGCPDCADGGAEWIQIDWKNGSKRVTFEHGQTVESIERLIAAVREMRQTYLSKM